MGCGQVSIDLYGLGCGQVSIDTQSIQAGCGYIRRNKRILMNINYKIDLRWKLKIRKKTQEDT